jgi:hypothetical protein
LFPRDYRSGFDAILQQRGAVYGSSAHVEHDLANCFFVVQALGKLLHLRLLFEGTDGRR